MLTQVFNRWGHCTLYALSTLVMRQALHPCWKLLWLICESLLLWLLCAVNDFKCRRILEVPHPPYVVNRWYTADIQIISQVKASPNWCQIISGATHGNDHLGLKFDVPFPPWALVQAAPALQARRSLRSRWVSISAQSATVGYVQKTSTGILNSCWLVVWNMTFI